MKSKSSARVRLLIAKNVLCEGRNVYTEDNLDA